MCIYILLIQHRKMQQMVIFPRGYTCISIDVAQIVTVRSLCIGLHPLWGAHHTTSLSTCLLPFPQTTEQPYAMVVKQILNTQTWKTLERTGKNRNCTLKESYIIFVFKHFIIFYFLKKKEEMWYESCICPFPSKSMSSIVPYYIQSSLLN